MDAFRARIGGIAFGGDHRRLVHALLEPALHLLGPGVPARGHAGVLVLLRRHRPDHGNSVDGPLELPPLGVAVVEYRS
jgi:hypothetical protein